MLNIQIICIGKLKETYLKSAIDEYRKRLSRYCKLEILELLEISTNNNEKKELEKELSNIIIMLAKIK